jgi:hypothetical protein
MDIFPYHPGLFSALIGLHETQNSQLAIQLYPESLPEIGFAVYSDDYKRFAAMGFLRKIEGGYAMIDTLVSNAKLSANTRHEAMSLLTKELVDTAKRLKLKGIISLTSAKDVISRAEDMGFKVINQVPISLIL